MNKRLLRGVLDDLVGASGSQINGTIVLVRDNKQEQMYDGSMHLRQRLNRLSVESNGVSLSQLPPLAKWTEHRDYMETPMPVGKVRLYIDKRVTKEFSLV